MKKIFIILILSFPIYLHSQSVIMEEHVDSTFKKPVFGPNLSHYFHPYFSLGAIIPSNNYASINSINSFLYNIGWRYKKKITNYYALGLDLQLQIHGYRIKQISSRRLPNNSTYQKEAFIFSQIESGIYQRFNFDKRGNHIGKFIDIGASYAFNIRATQRTKFRQDNYLTKIKYNQTNMFEPFIPYINCRIGNNRYMLFAQYRYSNLFLKNLPYSDLPPLTIGIQIGTY